MQGQPVGQIVSQSNVQNPVQYASVNAASFGSKFSSKSEVFRFCVSEAKIYLPSYQTVTIFHLRDLIAGRRKMVMQADVKVISVVSCI